MSTSRAGARSGSGRAFAFAGAGGAKHSFCFGGADMHLQNLVEIHLDVPRLAKDLDELGHAGRMWSVRRWTRANMALLWDAAKGVRPLALEDFVPSFVPPGAEVVHHGQNSLPAAT